MWLVADGTCRPYDGDMDDYRALLAENNRLRNPAQKNKEDVAENSAAARKDERRLAAQKRQNDAPRRKKLKETETALEKASAERENVKTKFQDPALYAENADKNAVTALQLKLAELDAEIERLENLWLELSEEGEL